MHPFASRKRLNYHGSALLAKGTPFASGGKRPFVRSGFALGLMGRHSDAQEKSTLLPVSQPVADKVVAELLRMEEDCTHSGKAHFNAADRWTWWNYAFGIPSVALSAAAGAAFFQDYAVIAGAMSSAVTVLTALMTFLKPSEKAADHKSSGDQYLSLRNDARVFREIELTQVGDDAAAIAGMNGFTTRRNELNQASPAFAKRDFRRAKKGIDRGEALHAVDKGKN